MLGSCSRLLLKRVFLHIRDLSCAYCRGHYSDVAVNKGEMSCNCNWVHFACEILLNKSKSLSKKKKLHYIYKPILFMESKICYTCTCES